MEQHPTRASSLGDRRWNDRWGDSSLDAISKRHDHDIETLTKLTKVDRAALSPSDQLNYDLFKKDYENEIEGFQYQLVSLAAQSAERSTHGKPAGRCASLSTPSKTTRTGWRG